MKFIIVSDSHGLTKELEKVVNAFPDADGYIHCGDSELNSDHPAILPYTTVNGNCDWNGTFPDEQTVYKDSHRLFITHGHLYNVKTTLLNLHYKAQEKGANIVCFGHSHLVGAEMIDGILFLNPGSLRLPRGRKERTFMMLEIEGNQLVVSIINVEQMEQPIEKISFTVSTVNR
ncbi:metallophosphoesterase family protein [Bacillus litorisediminis]|uniref:metallophosphoesterase family protein n=1 Tax=Bacillus litorisediminis TaxID=2922713 RepID=UPI001FADEE5E|nr:metallophosphoesterase [Bacillus litorisediminis]